MVHMREEAAAVAIAHETACKKKSEKRNAHSRIHMYTQTHTHGQTSAEIQQSAERNLFYSHFPHRKPTAQQRSSEKVTIASYNKPEEVAKNL